MARALLDAEVRLGELLKDRNEQVRSSRGGTSKPLPEGISKKLSHYAQTLADNKAIVEQVKVDFSTMRSYS